MKFKMFNEIKTIRNILIPGMIGVHCQAKLTKPSSDDNGIFVCRPSDLPVYQEKARKSSSGEQPEVTSWSTEPTEQIEALIGSARTEVSNMVENIGNYGEVLSETLDSFGSEIKSLTNYLQAEENLAPRAGAIVVGGMSGLILGLRGGIFRRISFATIGALSLAAVCFPTEALETSQLVLRDTKKYTTIAYNFMLGVKREDIETKQLPSIPTSLSEVWQLASDLGRSAQSLITGYQDGNEHDEIQDRKK